MPGSSAVTSYSLSLSLTSTRGMLAKTSLPPPTGGGVPKKPGEVFEQAVGLPLEHFHRVLATVAPHRNVAAIAPERDQVSEWTGAHVFCAGHRRKHAQHPVIAFRLKSFHRVRAFE